MSTTGSPWQGKTAEEPAVEELNPADYNDAKSNQHRKIHKTDVDGARVYLDCTVRRVDIAMHTAQLDDCYHRCESDS